MSFQNSRPAWFLQLQIFEILFLLTIFQTEPRSSVLKSGEKLSVRKNNFSLKFASEASELEKIFSFCHINTHYMRVLELVSHALMKCQKVIDIFSIRQNCQLSRAQSLK